MKGLIFEGPDGAGKTFTALEISRAVNLPLYHAGGPPKSPGELIERIETMQKLEGYVLDRFPIISDSVYAHVIRDESIVPLEDISYEHIPFPVIYCRPSAKTILESKLVTKPHKNQEHLSEVKRNIRKIINRYDFIMSKIPHIHFNRDEQTCADLILLLEKIT